MIDILEAMKAKDRQPALNPILAATLAGMAEVASGGAAERAATEQAELESKQKVTIGANGIATVTVPIADTEKRVQEAADEPRREVQKLLRKVGFVPDDVDDPRLSDGVRGFREGYRASRELRGNPIQAAIDGLRVKLGLISSESAAKQVQNKRAATNAELYRLASPLLDEAQQQRNSARVERSARQSALNTIIDNGAGRYDSEEAAVKAARDQMTALGHEWSDSFAEPVKQRFRHDRGRIERQASQTINQRISGMKDDDVRGYQSFDSWLADQEAELGTLPAFTRGRAEKRFRGIKEEMVKKEAKAEADKVRAEAREQRNIEASVRAAAASERAAASADRTLTNEQKKERQKGIDALLGSIKKNNDEISKNAIEYAKAAGKTDVQDALQKRNRELMDQNDGYADSLERTFGLKVKRAQRKVLSAAEAAKRL